jgi:hypothetical protein
MDIVKLRTRSLDKKKARVFVYHPDEKPLMVYEGEKLSMYDAGWFDSPAKFPGVEEQFEGLAKELGTTTKDKKFVKGVKKTLDRVAEETNEELNLKSKTAKELKAYADKYMPDMKYKKNAGAKKMLDLIENYKVDDDIIVIGADEDDPEVQEIINKEI